MKWQHYHEAGGGGGDQGVHAQLQQQRGHDHAAADAQQPCSTANGITWLTQWWLLAIVSSSEGLRAVAAQDLPAHSLPNSGACKQGRTVHSPATLPPSSMTMELRTMSFRPQLDGSAYGPCSPLHEIVVDMVQSLQPVAAQLDNMAARSGMPSEMCQHQPSWKVECMTKNSR